MMKEKDGGTIQSSDTREAVKKAYSGTGDDYWSMERYCEKYHHGS